MKIVILNKPYDVLSQFREDEKHLTMSAFVDDPDLRLAGRLDMDSEGLVFLTDHGGLNQFITNPANKKYKTYLVQVDGDVTEDALAQLRKGVELKDGITLPAQAYKVDEPEHKSVRKEMSRGRLLFYVTFEGGTAYLDVNNLREILEIQQNDF